MLQKRDEHTFMSVTVFWGGGCVEEGRKEGGKDSEMKGDGSQPGICISEVC